MDKHYRECFRQKACDPLWGQRAGVRRRGRGRPRASRRDARVAGLMERWRFWVGRFAIVKKPAPSELTFMFK